MASQHSPADTYPPSNTGITEAPHGDYGYQVPTLPSQSRASGQWPRNHITDSSVYNLPMNSESHLGPSTRGHGIPQADMSVVDPDLLAETMTTDVEPSTKKHKSV